MLWQRESENGSSQRVLGEQQHSALALARCNVNPQKSLATSEHIQAKAACHDVTKGDLSSASPQMRLRQVKIQTRCVSLWVKEKSFSQQTSKSVIER